MQQQEIENQEQELTPEEMEKMKEEVEQIKREVAEHLLKKDTDPEYAALYTNNDAPIFQIVEGYELAYYHGKPLTDDFKMIPSFHLVNHNLLIEPICDLYHSDAFIEDKNFFKKRRDYYKSLGYRSLFFRQDELEKKEKIISAVILQRIGYSPRIFARKTTIKLLSPKYGNKFLEENHLMGKGSGRCYALIYKEKCKAVIQVKWKNKNERQLEISRYCCYGNETVVGGFSKLLKHVIKEEQPNSIITFIDERYGTDNPQYLFDLGFKKKTSHLSFVWTNGEQTFHRMIFKKNSGYQYGFFKLWDCGQTKYELEIK